MAYSRTWYPPGLLIFPSSLFGGLGRLELSTLFLPQGSPPPLGARVQLTQAAPPWCPVQPVIYAECGLAATHAPGIADISKEQKIARPSINRVCGSH